MPFIGLGLHIVFAVLFAIHAVRTGQQLYWLVILFLFPGLGSIVYFVAVYLPNSGLERGARRAATAAGRALDPTRDLREAREAYEFTPTAQNQMRLAAALLRTGAADEAARNYEACLKGPFAADPDIQYCAAQAFLESGRADRAIERLEGLKAQDPGFRAEEVMVLLARALAAAGRTTEASAEFERAAASFSSFTVRAEQAIHAWTIGDLATARRLQAELDPLMQRWNRHTRDLNAPLVRRLTAARAGR